MSKNVFQRWGIMLDALAQIADVKKQLVHQGNYPQMFVPDALIEQWHYGFQDGKRLLDFGVGDELYSILLDFDYFINQVDEVRWSHPLDKQAYIKYDALWEDIREMAEWTIARIAFVQMPGDYEFGMN